MKFGTCQDHNILKKSVSTIFLQKFGFIFISALVIFQKYAMTSVHKNPKICANIHYFTNYGHTFRRY